MNNAQKLAVRARIQQMHSHISFHEGRKEEYLKLLKETEKEIAEGKVELSAFQEGLE